MMKMTDGESDMYGRTRYYGLPKYGDDTPLDLRDGYNRAVDLIDRILHQLDIKIQEK